MIIKQISSLQNPLIKNVVLLQDKAKERRNQNLTVVEGIKEISLAIEAPCKVSHLFFCPQTLEKEALDRMLGRLDDSVELIEVSKEVFEKIAYRESGFGAMLALVEPRKWHLENLKLSKNPLLLVLESVEKPGNLGAILRTADAAGIEAVLVCDPQTDLWNPNVIRSSIGCIFSVPTVVCTSEQAQNYLESKEIQSVATYLETENWYHEMDFRKPTAIVMGTEATGLSEKWLDFCTHKIKIPMAGKIDSLNVSTATAIVVFEAKRQRWGK